ncbi:hypothetical protein SAMN05518800_6894 [Variovorax sp. YR752]|uniref:hypothetical protein n=1 Tax=unclassified Variovorax TaxID=663243 RepID=UPI000BD15E83|nr:hypothetical protein [Variovorax sp. YR752]SOE06258.1 hypothetical protein SAMN05518800_6894 [Variovorax sp. YR752]
METIVLEAVQWSRLPNIEEADPLGDADYAVLREMGEVLKRHGKTARFGVCLLHRHFHLAAGEELMEETDAHARISVLRVQPAQPGREDSIETMWRFGDAATAITKCVVRCLKTGTSHPRGHIREGA